MTKSNKLIVVIETPRPKAVSGVVLGLDDKLPRKRTGWKTTAEIIAENEEDIVTKLEAFIDEMMERVEEGDKMANLDEILK